MTKSQPKICEIQCGTADSAFPVQRKGYLLDQIQLNGTYGEIIDELVRLSKHYGIITPYTNFLADERVALNVPMGVGITDVIDAGPSVIQILGSNIVGGIAQMNANNINMMVNAPNVMNSNAIQGIGSNQIGQSTVPNYELNKVENLANVQNLNNRTLYKRGSQWIDSVISDRDITKLNAESKPVAQFSDEYF